MGRLVILLDFMHIARMTHALCQVLISAELVRCRFRFALAK